MGKADVIQAIFDSYELVKENYRKIALPLIVLLILSGAGSFGGNSLSRPFSDRYSKGSNTTNSLIANAATDAGALMGTLAAGLMGALLVVLLIVIVLAIIVAILEKAVWFYVYEHFYSILTGKKITQDWKGRMKRHAGKAVVFLLFWFLLAVLSAVPALAFFLATHEFSLAILALLGLGILALLFFALVFTPLWIYYAMEGKGMFASAGASAGLVAGNLGTFAAYFLISFLVWVAQAGAILISACCCLAWIISPLLDVFFGLVLGVALMKVKLALEK